MIIAFIVMLSVLGFGLSLYAYQLEEKLKTTPDYKATCDINDYISCTKPIKSEYSNLFYVSNAILGMVFYFAAGLFAILKLPVLLLVLTSIGVLTSLVLGYILYVKINSLCLVCTSLYITNITLFLLALRFYYMS